MKFVLKADSTETMILKLYSQKLCHVGTMKHLLQGLYLRIIVIIH